VKLSGKQWEILAAALMAEESAGLIAVDRLAGETPVVHAGELRAQGQEWAAAVDALEVRGVVNRIRYVPIAGKSLYLIADAEAMRAQLRQAQEPDEA
jgi:hypothetical protein